MNDLLLTIQAVSIIATVIIMVVLLLTIIRVANAFELIAISLSNYLDKEMAPTDKTPQNQ